MTQNDLRGILALPRGVRFLNYAATAPMAAAGAEAMIRVAREGTHPMGDHFTAWLTIVESARRAVADLIRARVDEITFAPNTSTALSLAAAAIRWRVGDRVLYPADEFPSNRFVWDNLEDLGVRAEGIAPERGVGFGEQLAARDLSGVRLVALSAVSYRDGRRLDIEGACRRCRERGILTVVDAIQAAGAIPVDARAWGCDFLACGGQKWLLGPVGSGFLYVARERLADLHVPTVGWASSRHAGEHETPALEFCEGAARFEAGLPDVAAIAALAASLDALASVGWETIFSRTAAHRARLAEALARRGLAPLHDGPPGTHAGIVTVAVPEDRVGPLTDSLHRRRVIVTRRRQDIRVAAHAVTADEEVEIFLEALDEALGTRGPARRKPLDSRAAAAAASEPPRPATWRRALVTGASRGLGAAIAAELTRAGCAVTLVARDPAALERAAAELQTSSGVAIRTVTLDLADRAAVERWIASNLETLADLDLLVNNAARADAATFLDAEPASERAAFEANLFAPIALARATLPGMIARGRGAILNVATSGARNALPLFSAYAASKGALWAWSEALGRELDGSGVTVTTFVPPHMDTATRRQLGRRAVGFYDVGSAADAEGHRPGQADRLGGVARRALAAAAAGHRVAMPRRARWEILLNAAAPGRVAAQVRRRWKGSGRPGKDRA